MAYDADAKLIRIIETSEAERLNQQPSGDIVKYAYNATFSVNCDTYFNFVQLW